MPQYKINTDKVLIVPGYTDAEILKNQEKNKKNKKNSSKNNEKTASNMSIAPPAAFYFEVQNVQYTPHIASYEEFNSAEGVIRLEKACDRFAEVEMDVFVHQNISDQKGQIMIDKETREARLRVNDISIEEGDRDNGIYVKRFVRPEEFTEKYIEVRNNFFQDLNQRPLTIVSSLFPPIPACYMTECSYNIGEGEEEATYSVTFSEVTSTMI